MRDDAGEAYADGWRYALEWAAAFIEGAEELGTARLAVAEQIRAKIENP